jgi:hypothetical protein
VCREPQGNARHLRCFYHAWTFDTRGRLVSLPSPEAYPQDSSFRERLGLRPAGRLEVRRDFVFISFDPAAGPLDDYLGPAGDYLELVADHSEASTRVVPGTQHYLSRASFIGPGGLATPDHLEAQEAIQRAIQATAGDNRPGVDWNDVSRGMQTETDGEPVRTVDEGRVRAFWRQWSKLLQESEEE